MAKRDNNINLQTSSLLIRVLIGAFVSFMAVFILGPLVWLALQAFSTTWTFPNLKPDGWTLIWWKRVFETPSMVQAIKNSFITAPIVVLVSAIICLPAAYAAARYNYIGRRVFLIGMFAANSFPKLGLFASIATLFYTLNLMGTMVGVIIIQLIGTIIYMTWIPAAAFAAALTCVCMCVCVCVCVCVFVCVC
jgi:putative spermidine/putrescine transport system permease protein